LRVPDNTKKDENESSSQGRKFIGVLFKCCNVYSRVYVSRQGDRYVGYCPKCGKRVRLVIGPGGVDDRFFTAE